MILYKKVGKGTELMTHWEEGDEVDLIGPLGRGYTLPPSPSPGPIVLLGGGVGVASLYALWSRLKDRNVSILVGAKTKDDILWPFHDPSIKEALRIATEDGSLGWKGTVLDLFLTFLRENLKERPLRIYACGPMGMLKGLSDLTRSESMVVEASLEATGEVRVAAIYSIGIHAMSRHVQRFMAEYPRAKVRLEYLRPTMVVDSVLNDQVDLGIVSFPSHHRALNAIPLRRERMVLVCPPDHRLAKLRTVRANDLAGEDLIAFDRDLAIRRAIDRVLKREHVSVNVVMEFDNIENIKLALASGAGVSVLPEPTVQREVERGTLVARPLQALDLERPIAIIHRRRKRLTPVALKFVQELKSD